MKTIEDIRAALAACRESQEGLKARDEVEALIPCNRCCSECTTEDVLVWVLDEEAPDAD